MLLLLRQEWRLLRANQPYWVALLLLAMLTALAFQIGRSRSSRAAEHAERYRVEQAELQLLVKEAVQEQSTKGGRVELRRGMMENPSVDLEQLFQRPLNDIEQGRFRVLWNFAKGRTSIINLPWRTWKAPSPLAVLSVGESDLWANAYSLSASQSAKTLLSSRLSNPFHQMIGALDLSTLLTVILPLIIIVLLHDFVSLDQEQGTLRIIRSQNVSFRKLVAIRLAVRLTGIVLTVLTVVLAGAAVSGMDLSESATWRLLSLFSISVLTYALFWGSCTWLVNSVGLSSIANAVLLTICWILLVIVVPLGWAQAVERAYPVSSLDSLVAKERELREAERIQRSQRREAAQRAAGTDGETRQRQNLFYEAVKEMEQRQAVIHAEIEQALNRQFARVKALQDGEKWSPAFAFKSLSDEISGNSRSRFLEFSRQTNDFQMELKSYFRIRPDSAQTPLTTDEVAKMPMFQPSADRAISGERWQTTILTLAVWSILPLLFGYVGFRVRFP